jgi:hypothetical protein
MNNYHRCNLKPGFCRAFLGAAVSEPPITDTKISLTKSPRFLKRTSKRITSRQQVQRTQKPARQLTGLQIEN